MYEATEREVKRAANKSVSMASVLRKLGYSSEYPGGNTTRRFKRILGDKVYNEINSRSRRSMPVARWTKVKINK